MTAGDCNYIIGPEAQRQLESGETLVFHDGLTIASMNGAGLIVSGWDCRGEFPVLEFLEEPEA